MKPLAIVMFFKPLLSRIAVPAALGAVEEMTKPLRSSVTLLAVIVTALPVVTFNDPASLTLAGQSMDSGTWQSKRSS
jgi:hypothetical protein